MEMLYKDVINSDIIGILKKMFFPKTLKATYS